MTNYNPQNRDASGRYMLLNEWTSVSDVGKTFDGRVFSMAQYVETEEKHIKALIPQWRN
ncbi:hypothetical protein [Planococcus lenghuensis]|nr:hypothetical protein [Planococcus lenghuensis]